jgi:hypothetical protein
MKIQRIRLVTTIDLQYNRTLELMNPVAYKDDIDSLVDKNRELGECGITREVLDVPEEVYDRALCAPKDELEELFGCVR